MCSDGGDGCVADAVAGVAGMNVGRHGQATGVAIEELGGRVVNKPYRGSCGGGIRER